MADLPKSKAPSGASAQSNSSNEQFNSLFALNERAFTSWVRGVSAFAEEVGRFTQTRLHEDAEVWQVLATCRTPMDALECQRRYAEKAAGDYMDEANKLTRLAVDAANEGLSSLQKTASG